MAPHSSSLAWKIPWAEEPGRLQSMGSWRVRNDWATSLSLFTFTHWRRKWQPIPVFLPGKSHGQRDLMGCSLWGCKESDTTKQLTHTHFVYIYAKYSLEHWTDTHLIIAITFMRYALLITVFIDEDAKSQKDRVTSSDYTASLLLSQDANPCRLQNPCS